MLYVLFSDTRRMSLLTRYNHSRLLQKLPYTLKIDFSQKGLATLRNCQAQLSGKRHILSCLKGVTSEVLCFIPVRNFGQGQKIRVFGHAKVKSTSKYPDGWPLIIGAPVFIVIFCLMDWKTFQEKFFRLPNFLREFKTMLDEQNNSVSTKSFTKISTPILQSSRLSFQCALASCHFTSQTSSNQMMLVMKFV